MNNPFDAFEDLGPVQAEAGECTAASEIDAIRRVFAARGPVVPLDGDCTEAGISRAIAGHVNGLACYDHRAEDWRFWTGERWARDSAGIAQELAKEACRTASENRTPAEKAKLGRAATVSGVERLARSEPALAVDGSGWDTDPMLLGCPGGVTVDLCTGKKRQSDPADGITKLAGVAPEDGPCPQWFVFLDHVARGDEDVIAFLQLWVGYLLTGLTIEHVLLFVYGPGGNGKSVLMNILLRLLGDYGAVASMETFAAAGKSQHGTFLASLEGARLVTASETDEGRGWAESRLKSITGGDAVTANYMHSDPFTFTPACKIMIAGNFMPNLSSGGPAMQRRLLLLPVTKTPAQVDPELEDKLWQEAPRILEWAVRGCLVWREEGLPRPAAVTAATDQYFKDQDLFGDWLDACTEAAEVSAYETAGALFASWKVHAEANGEKPGTSKTFGQRLRRRGLESALQRVNGAPARVWHGIRLRVD